MIAETAARAFDFIRRRKINYQLAAAANLDPSQPATQEVLIDLAKFCRANETCVDLDKDGRVDKDMTLILEGRREVWCRIQNHLKLTPSQLYALYTGRQFNPGETDG